MKATNTKFILTSLAYIIPTMFLGYTWHLIIFKNLYSSLGIYNRVESIILLGFTSIIVQRIIMAFLYSYFARENYSMATAIKFSLLMGLFLFSVTILANVAKIQVTTMHTWLFIQVAFHLLQFTVAEILIGIVTKKNG